MHEKVMRRFDAPELLSGALRSPAGGLVARPWFDRVALSFLAHWFFPLSRLWAAARTAQGSTAGFLDEAGLSAVPVNEKRLAALLHRFEDARQALAPCESGWENAFFGSSAAGNETLAQIERRRLAARHNYNAMRWRFATLGVRRRVSTIKWDIPSPDFVEGVYGPAIEDPVLAFGAPDPMPEVEVSRAVRTGASREYWIRFPSPAPRMNDTLVARVYEPAGLSNPPTLIFGHGICVEFDHWRGLVDEVAAMVAMGIRVVRPESPWHGRRVRAGRYGGENFMATAPIGALDLFSSAAREWAVIIDWCRSNSAGPVAVGGSSLGAMTAQLVAEKAHLWPARLRPDALFLITHCGEIEEAVSTGALAARWGIIEATAARGWTPGLVSRYQPLLDPLGQPVMAPDAIVSVLGRRDEVTPYPSGKALVERWRLPEQNLFEWSRGHFSVPIAMMHDHTPLTRFRDVLAAV